MVQVLNVDWCVGYLVFEVYMSYEDVEKIKRLLHNAYINACCESGEFSEFTESIQVVAFVSGGKKISVQIEDVD